MYYCGFMLLPWVWLLSILYFRKELKKEETPPMVINYVRKSLVAVITTTVAFLSWVFVFQWLRTDWGQVGDMLTVVVPRGSS